MPRNLEIPELTPEQSAELGTVVRACGDIIAQFGIDAQGLAVMEVMVNRLLREALGRAKPNRRLSYLEQWSSFLAWCAAGSQGQPADKRLPFLLKTLEGFRLQDAKGRRGPARSEMHSKANCWIDKDGQRWEAQAPPAHEEAERLIVLTDLGGSNRTANATAERVIEHPQLDTSKAKPLRPTNTPEALLQQYERIYAELADLNIRNREVRGKVLAGIPECWKSRWFETRITKSDLALLVAAQHVGLTPSVENLSTFREMLAGARMARRAVEARNSSRKEIRIIRT